MKKKRVVILLILVAIIINLSLSIYGGTCCYAPYGDFCESELTESQCCGTLSPCIPNYFNDTHSCDQTEYCSISGCCVQDCSWKQRSLCPNSTFYDAFEIFDHYNQNANCDGVTECTRGCCCYKDAQGKSISYDIIYAHECQAGGYSASVIFYPGDTSCDLCPTAGYQDSVGGVYGIIRDSGLNLIHNARIEIGGKVGFSNQGSYSISDIPAGTWTIKFYALGYQPVIQPNFLIEKDIDVEHDVTFSTATSVGEVYGTVTNTSGSPLQGAAIFYTGSPAFFTDGAGEYRITNVPSGTMTFTASKAGYNNEVTSFTVQPGMVNELNFVLDRTPISETCGNQLLDPGEECDTVLTGTPCDGICIPPGLPNECQCPSSCADLGGHCCVFDYQCTGVGGSYFSNDFECSGLGSSSGCCDNTCETIPNCWEDISQTYIDDKNGPMCKCGSGYYDAQTDTGWCCADEYHVVSDPCEIPGALQGFVLNTSNIGISDAKIVLTLAGTTAYETIASSDGSYSIMNIVPGTYNATITAGYYHTLTVGNIVITSNVITWMNFTLDRMDTTCIIEPIPDPELNASHTKGVPEITLTWDSPCTSVVSSWWLYKDGSFIGSFPAGTTSYVDSDLEWDDTVNYEIVMKLGSGLSGTTSIDVFTGNEYCDGIDTGPTDPNPFSFCLDALTDPNPDEIKILRVVCDETNKGVYWDGTSAGNPNGDCTYAFGSEAFCQELAGDTWCVDTRDQCEQFGINDGGLTIDNLFGMYYDKTFCLFNGSDRNYCFYDYSDTTVDVCLKCDPKENCYSYTSEDACLADNCLYASKGQGCQWFEQDYFFSEVGNGICYMINYTGTQECDRCGPNSELFFNVECTDEVCSYLGSCYSVSDTGTSTPAVECNPCDENVVCEDYTTQFGCTGADNNDFDINGGSCPSSEEFRESEDSCQIGKCHWSGGVCFKDGDDDSTRDCAASQTNCQRDFVSPETDIDNMPPWVNADGYDFTFSIDDDNSIEDAFYCVDIGTTGTCCPRDPLQLENDSASLTVPNARVDLTGIEDTITIRFYSVDEWKNVEEIKQKMVYVDTVAPGVTVNYIVSNNTDNNMTSDLEINITVDERSFCTDSLTDQTQQMALTEVLPPEFGPYGPNGPSYSYSYESLSDYTYLYTLNCSDEYDNTFIYQTFIKIDRIQMIYNESPVNKTLNTTTVRLYVKTKGDQFYCRYQETQPVTGSWETFNVAGQGISDGAGDYYYEAYVYGRASDTYNYDVQCFYESTFSTLADTANLFFTVDLIPPNTTIWIDTGAGDIPYVSGDVYKNPSLLLKSHDIDQGPPDEFGLDKILYCIEDGAVCDPDTEYTGAFGLPGGGIYNICFKGIDNGGNAEPTECTSINNDIIDPRVSFDAHDNVTSAMSMRLFGKWDDDSAVNIYVIVEDDFDRSYYFNAIVGDKVFYVDIDLFSGKNYITVTAEDAAGNTGKNYTIIYQDSIGPDFINANIYDYNGQLVLEENVQNGNLNERGHLEFGKDGYFLVLVKDLRWTNEVTSISGVMTCEQPCTYSVNFDMDRVSTLVNSSDYGFFSTDYNHSWLFLLENRNDMPPDIGRYNVTYTAYDSYGNPSTHSQIFTVNDTIGPEYNITIITSTYSRSGWPKVTRGIDYDVQLETNEPLLNITNFEYSVFNPYSDNTVKQLTPISGSGMSWLFSMRIYDNAYFDNLYGNNTEFKIIAFDTHKSYSTEDSITSGRYFEIDTFGGYQPMLYPTIPNPLSTKNLSLYITGFVNPPEGDVSLRYEFNSSINQYSNTIPVDWSINIDNATVIGPNNEDYDVGSSSVELVGDKASTFTLGRYIGFGHLRKHGQRYQITGSAYSSTADTTLVTFSPALEQIVRDGEEIGVYLEETPTGWFEFSVNLDYGNNTITMREIDDMGNLGDPYTQIVYFDDVPPMFYNITPPPDSFSPRNFTNISLIVSDEFSALDESSILLQFKLIGGSTINYTCGSSLKCTDFNGMPNAKKLFIDLGLLNFGDYEVTVYAADVLNNSNSVTWNFFIGPQFNITLHTMTYSRDGWPKVTRGRDYQVDLRSNTPLMSVSYFKYSVFNPYSNFTEKDLTYSSGSGNVWTYRMRIYDNSYFDHLFGNNTEFLVRATDVYGSSSDETGIAYGRYFEIDTFGGYQPDLEPDIISPYYTKNTSIFITGFLNPREGDMSFRYTYNYSGGSTTDTMSVDWSTMIDDAFVHRSGGANYNPGDTEIEVTYDKTSTFTVGSYLEFANKRTHFQRYRITSAAYSPIGDVTVVEFTPALETVVSSSSTVGVYAEEVPTGWFGFTLNLAYGRSLLRMQGIDDMNNYGDELNLSFIVDNEPPIIYEPEPYPNSFSAKNNTNVTAKIYEDLSGLNIGMVRMRFGKVNDTLTEYSCGSSLLCTSNPLEPNVTNLNLRPGLLDFDSYQVLVLAEDNLANRANLSWNFTVSRYFPEINVSDSNFFGGDWYTKNSRPTINVTLDSGMGVTIYEASFPDDGISVSCSEVSAPAGKIKYVCSMGSSFTTEKKYVLRLTTRQDGIYNEKIWTYNIIYDITAPIVLARGPDKTNQKVIKLIGNYSDLYMSNYEPIIVTGDTDYNATQSYCTEFPNYLGVPCTKGMFGDFSIDVRIDNSSDGTKTLFVKAYDIAGNEGTAIVNVEFDTTPPTISIDDVYPVLILDGRQVTNNGTVNIEGTYDSSDTSDIWVDVEGPLGMVSYDNISTTGNNYELKYINLNYGTIDYAEFNITAKATDSLGNVGSASTIVYVDHQGPKILNFSPEKSKDNPPTIEIITDEYATCNVSYVDYRLFNITDDLTPDASHKIHTKKLSHKLTEVAGGEVPTTLMFECKDIFGQSSKAQKTIMIDHMRPMIVDIKLTNPDGHLINMSYPSFDYILFFDPVSAIEVTASEDVICKYSDTDYNYNNMNQIFIGHDTKYFAQVVQTDDITFQDKTDYRYFIGCEDKAGNIANFTILNIIVDLFGPIYIHDIQPTPYAKTLKPTVTAKTYRDAVCELEATSGQVYLWDFVEREYMNGKVEMQLSFEDGYFLHSTRLSSEEGTTQEPLDENGEYSFTISCDYPDDARVPSASKDFSFIVDSTPPFIDITYPTNAMVSDRSIIDVYGTNEPGSDIRIFVNDIEQTPTPIHSDNGTFETFVTLKDGFNKINATAYDIASNQASDVVTVEYNSVGPYVTFIDPVDGSVLRTIDYIKAQIKSDDGTLDFTRSSIQVYKDDENVTGSITLEGNNTMRFTPSSPFEDGGYRAVVTPWDDYFGVPREGTKQTATFLLDVDYPNIILLTPDTEIVHEEIVEFSGYIIAEAGLKSKSLVVSGMTYPLVLNGSLFRVNVTLVGGENNYTIFAKNYFDEESIKKGHVILPIDNIPPWLTLDEVIGYPLLTVNGKEITNNSTLTVKGRFNRSDTYSLTINVSGPQGIIVYDILANTTDDTYEYTFELHPGFSKFSEFTISVIAADKKGNHIARSAVVYLDYQGPQVVKLTPEKTTDNPPTIEIVTDEYANYCKVTYRNSDDDFITQDMAPNHNNSVFTVGMTHRLPEIAGGEYPTRLMFNCSDIFGLESISERNLMIDFLNPNIINVTMTSPDAYILNSSYPVITYILYYNGSSAFEIFASKPVICKYSESTSEYYLMENKMSGFDERNYNTTQSSEIIQFNDLAGYKYYIACEDWAGNVAPYMTLNVKVDLFGPVYIHDVKPTPYSKTNTPTITARTFRDASCKIEVINQNATGFFATLWDFLEGLFTDTEVTMERTKKYGYYLHSAKVSKESGGIPIALEENGEYNFKITCDYPQDDRVDSSILEFSFIVDSTDPDITITAPYEGYQSDTSPVDVTGTTELHSFIDIYVNFNKQTTDPIYCPDGTFAGVAILENGPNKITVEATDKASNTDSDDVDVVYNAVSPYVERIQPVDGSVLSNLSKIEALLVSYDGLLALDESKIILTKNGTEIPGDMTDNDNNTIYFTPTVELEDGYYKVSVIPYDYYYGSLREGAGKVATFLVDQNYPQIILLYPDSEYVIEQKIVFKGYIIAESGILSKKLVIDGKTHYINLVGSVFNATATIKEGQNNYSIHAENYFKQEAIKKGVVILDTKGPAEPVVQVT